MLRFKLSVIYVLVLVCVTLTYKVVVTYNDIVDMYASRIQQHDIATTASIALMGQDTVKSVQPKSPVKETRLDAYDNPSWVKKYSKEGSRTVRFGVTSRDITFDKKYTNWKGGKRIAVADMRRLVKNVCIQLPHVKTNENVISLIVETAIAESSGGYYIDEKTGDLGILQIRASTANDLLNWLDYQHKDIRTAILKLKNARWSMEDNLRYNVPFSIAVSITEYWRKAGPSYSQHIDTVEQRAVMWTSVYNTSKGKGTVNKYKTRVDKYASHIAVTSR